MSFNAQFTVGNLGASEARCVQVKMISDSISVSCNTGSISAVTQMGAYAKDSEADQRGLCTAEGVSVSTGVDCESLSQKDHPFFAEKLQACVGQESCLIHGVHDDIPIGSQPGAASCNLNEEDTLFIQYNCQVSEEELGQKRH